MINQLRGQEALSKIQRYQISNNLQICLKL